MGTSIEIQAPASAAWEILTDTSRWPESGAALVLEGGRHSSHDIGPSCVKKLYPEQYARMFSEK